MWQSRCFTACVTTALVTSCGSDAGPGPTSPSNATLAPSREGASGPPQRASGVVITSIPGIGAQRFTFTAVHSGDDRTSGQFELFSEQNGGLRLHGNVICLRIAAIDGGHVARVAGITTQSAGLNSFVGDRWIWTVVDRGQGSTAQPDLATDLVLAFPDEVEGFCAGTFESPFHIPFEVTRGNIQVQP
jgi:hypothetical protein